MSLSFFEAFLQSLTTHPILDDVSKADYVALDLSIDNAELKSVNVSSSEDLEDYIWKNIKKNNAKAAFGGYLERRGIYQRSTYFNKQNPDTERNIHLGLDLWIEARTTIHAPLDATLHSFKNNKNHGDYGPTIILKHNLENFIFYTLYGHLSIASIDKLSIGTEIKRGEPIATLGSAEVNGDYPPHLHFQIIKDIEAYKGDYPGVCNPADLEFYKQNCPDPKLLLHL